MGERKCCNCVFYSVQNSYCGARNIKNSPEGNCIDFRSEESLRNMKGRKCCNCAFYSIKKCYCGARNRRSSPEGNCVDFRQV